MNPSLWRLDTSSPWRLLGYHGDWLSPATRLSLRCVSPLSGDRDHQRGGQRRASDRTPLPLLPAVPGRRGACQLHPPGQPRWNTAAWSTHRETDGARQTEAHPREQERERETDRQAESDRERQTEALPREQERERETDTEWQGETCRYVRRLLVRQREDRQTGRKTDRQQMEGLMRHAEKYAGRIE